MAMVKLMMVHTEMEYDTFIGKYNYMSIIIYILIN